MNCLKTLLLRSSLSWLIVAASLVFGACGSDDDPGPYIASDPDKIEFDVDWKPETKMVTGLVNHLTNADFTTNTYTFGGTAEELQDLAALAVGDIAVVDDVGLFKIEEITVSGDQVVIKTADAQLSDAIQDGTIEWDLGFDPLRTDRFIGIQVGALEPMRLYPRKAVVNSAIGIVEKVEWSGSWGGFNVKITMAPAGENIDFTISASYDVGKAKGKIVGKGTIRGYRTSGLVLLENGTTTNFRFVARGIDVDMDLEFGAVELGMMDGNFSFPAKIVLPFALGPIPAWYSMGSVIEVQSTLKAETSALAKAHLKFRGAAGIRKDTAEDSGLMPMANIDNIDVEFIKGESVATLTSGLGVLIQFPRIEVGLGLPGTGAESYMTVKNEVVANTNVKYEAAGPYPVITGTCLEVGVNLGVYVGGAFKALGFTLASKEFQVGAKINPKKRFGKCE
jgi:hypothetical protein